jgi:polysaccharide biosynthesis protein PslG
MTRRRKPIVALVLGVCVSACMAQAGEASRHAHAQLSSATPLGGVNVEGLRYGGLTLAEADRTIAVAHALHAGVVRFEVPWSILESRGPNQIDPGPLAYVDRLMSDAAADGIRTIMIVDGTPCWASSAPAKLRRRCRPGRDNAANRWPPAHPAAYATFVGYLTQRYGDRLAAIEVWNEPDQANEKYFAGPNKAKRYAAILRAAYPAVKRADANVEVLAASLVGYNGLFLRALYAAGIKGYYDGLAVHFYSLTLASIRSFRSVELAHGDSTPLWLDEFGWSSCYPRLRVQEEQACVTSQVQALNITSLYHALSGTGYIAAVALYQMQDGGSESFGVLSARGVRKPAFAALRNVLTSPAGSPPPVTLSLSRRAGYVLASGSGPVGDYMHLEVLRGNVPRFRAIFTLNRFNRYSIKLPSALGTSGLTVRVFQNWMGPGRDAQKRI